MTATYEKIATTTLGTAAASVTFSSISSAYTDIVVIATGQVVTESTLYFRFNGDTGSNYSSQSMVGNGSTTDQIRFTSTDRMYFYNWKTSPSNAIFNIQNYSNSTTYKTVLSRINGSTGYASATVGLWRSTAAINELLIHSNDTFASGSTFTLYGIKAE
jgi:hypothetical protein